VRSRWPARAGLLFAAGLGALLAGPAPAAPLDALLTALPERTAPVGYIELGVDRLNSALDFSTSNDTDPALQPPASGSYRGFHAAGALRVTDSLWLSGGLWQRDISSAADTFRYLGWQAAGQYRFNDAAGAMPAVALRLGAWGNRSKATETTTPVRVQGAVLDTVKVSQPADQQLQADLLATWQPSPRLDISAVLGVGRTRLSYDALSATTRRNGCNYQLAFNGNDIFGNLIEPCTVSGGVIRQFYDSSGDYGVDVANEIAWQGRFWQVGVNAGWRDGPWTLLGGILFHEVRREAVDEILAGRGNPVHRHNRIVALEAGYEFQPGWTVLLRNQISSNLFFNDIPVTYNTSTSGSFSNRYSLFTLGLRAGF
jgi:hypothetical protein